MKSKKSEHNLKGIDDSFMDSLLDSKIEINRLKKQISDLNSKNKKLKDQVEISNSCIFSFISVVIIYSSNIYKLAFFVIRKILNSDEKRSSSSENDLSAFLLTLLGFFVWSIRTVYQEKTNIYYSLVIEITYFSIWIFVLYFSKLFFDIVFRKDILEINES